MFSQTLNFTHFVQIKIKQRRFQQSRPQAKLIVENLMKSLNNLKVKLLPLIQMSQYICIAYSENINL